MDKVKPKSYVVRVRPDLHERVVQLAKDNHRSLNNQTVFILEAWFDVPSLLDRVAQLERD